VSAQPKVYEAGVHYQELATPLPDLDPDRIDVVELFWYGCPDCYEQLPTFQMWEASYRTTDMTFARMPVVWNLIMETHAHIYLTANELKLFPEVSKSAWEVTPGIHNAIFDAIHKNNNPLNTSAQAAELFAAWGVSTEAFEQAWNSATVLAKLEELKKLPGMAEIPRLPALVVHGRYVINFNAAVTTNEELYKVLSFLVVKIRGTKRVESQ
jgi:thiol:disulfide interchange protein DsbA